jgi:hypothetical protein
MRFSMPGPKPLNVGPLSKSPPGLLFSRPCSLGPPAYCNADLSMKSSTSRRAKVAGRLLLTHEIVQDTSDAFSSVLVSDLARSIYNAESNLLLNGTSGANGFNGINQGTGTLTRAAAIGTTDYDALDVLSKAFVDLRADYFVRPGDHPPRQPGCDPAAA